MSERRREERFANDEDYRLGWYGPTSLPSVDYDDGFTAGLRSRDRLVARLFLLWVVAFVGMAAVAFILGYSAH